MAYYDDTDQEEGEGGSATSQNTQAVSAGGGQAVSPDAGVTGAAGAAKAPVTASSGPSSTAQSRAPTFVGIQDYINANQPQTTKLANSIANDASNTGTDALMKIGANKSDYNTAVNAGAAGTGPYTGPAQFEGTDQYTAAQQAAQKAQDYDTNLGSTAGISNILGARQAANHNGQINQGALTLDNALVTADPNSQATLNTAKQGLDNLNIGDAFNNAATSADASRQTAINAQTARTQAAAARGPVTPAAPVVQTSVKGLSAAPAKATPQQSTAALQAKITAAATAQAQKNAAAKDAAAKAQATADAQAAAAKTLKQNIENSKLRTLSMQVGG